MIQVKGSDRAGPGRRAPPGPAGRLRALLPCAPADNDTRPQGKGRLSAGRRAVRLINTHGQQVVDTWAFCRDDLGEFMSMEHSHAALSKILPSTGDTMVSNRRRPMLTFVEDNSGGIHDTVIAACDRWRYERLGVAGHHDNCTDNLRAALAELGLEPPEIPSPLNMFMNIPVGPGGAISWEPSIADPGSHVVLLRRARPGHRFFGMPAGYRADQRRRLHAKGRTFRDPRRSVDRRYPVPGTPSRRGFARGDRRRIGDEGAAATVAGDVKLAGDVLAEQGQVDGLGPAADGQRAALVVARLLVAERRSRAESDIDQIDSRPAGQSPPPFPRNAANSARASRPPPEAKVIAVPVAAPLATASRPPFNIAAPSLAPVST